MPKILLNQDNAKILRMSRFALAALFCAAVLAPPALGAQTYPASQSWVQLELR
jgi:hypothetical protein